MSASQNARALPPEPRKGGVRRRDLFVGGGALLVGAAAGLGARPVADAVRDAVGGSADTAATTATDTTRRFASFQPTISAIGVDRVGTGSLGEGYLFSAVAMDVHRGVVFDDDGEPVWIDPTGADMYDLRVQVYRGEPVLTYTSGLLVDGYGVATGTILDRNYDTVATVRGVGGVSADLHEFLLTDDGTAVITAYPVSVGDLRSVGGTREGHFLDCRVQEIDVATGELLLDWRASDHIAVDESHQPLGSGGTAASPYDPFHLNAVAVGGTDGDALLVSARHTHALYAIDRSTGDVRWRMNGKKSDFDVADGAVFAWQHHVTRQTGTTLTVFDNHVKAASGSSRGLVLEVDEDAMTVRRAAEYAYDGRRGTAMGSVQHLANGNVLVGWGTGKSATEFAADGTALVDVRFDGASYRSFRSTWTGTPSSVPAVAVRAASGSTSSKDADGTVRAYATWNGSTETVSWRFEYGASASALDDATTVDRDGFETSATVPAAGYVRAVALDASGAVLAASHATRTGVGTT